MSRLVPYRAKVPDAIKFKIEETLTTTMYLVQTTGPTSYVIQEQNCDKKYKVLIGSLQSCSCGDHDVCIHILFVMLKVLRVPPTTAIVWQKSLIDSEIEGLLRGDYREKTQPPPRTNAAFLKKRKEEIITDGPETHEAQRHVLVDGEVCAICQEDMHEDQPLTYCRTGCGNNFHIECMKVFGESRKQSKEHIICPLCRNDWGEIALTVLKKEFDEANKAPDVHKGVACKKCHTKPLRKARYRCVQCKNTDLCERCFKMNAHINHSFVMKAMVNDTWIAAVRADSRRALLAAEIANELEGREITTNDYELLLELDRREKYPIQEYLMSILGGQKVLAANAKTFGDPGAICTLCRQSLRIMADVRSLLCGHVFHESCLARSVLGQTYSCPQPACDHVMFPGLHTLVVKDRAKRDESQRSKANDADLAKMIPPGLDASLCVMSIQQISLAGDPSSRSSTIPNKKNLTTRLKTMPTRECKVPDVGRLSLGLVSLPALRPTSNGQSAMSPDTDARIESSTSMSGGIAAKGTQRLPTFSDGGDLMTKLQLADDTREELKKSNSERLRNERAKREDRVRQNQSNKESNQILSNLLPSIGGQRSESLDERLARASEQRVLNQRRLQHEKSNKRRQVQEQQQQNEQRRNSPHLDLSIAPIRHL